HARRRSPTPRLIKLLFAASVGSLAPALTLAGSFAVFGPEAFPRGTGLPKKVVRHFSLANPSVPYLLRATVQNPTKLTGADAREDEREDAAALFKVSATITLNGVQILARSDFNRQTTVLERAVTAQASNEIDVTVQGPRGGAVIVEIIGTDND